MLAATQTRRLCRDALPLTGLGAALDIAALADSLLLLVTLLSYDRPTSTSR